MKRLALALILLSSLAACSTRDVMTAEGEVAPAPPASDFAANEVAPATGSGTMVAANAAADSAPAQDMPRETASSFEPTNLGAASAGRGK